MISLETVFDSYIQACHFNRQSRDLDSFVDICRANHVFKANGDSGVVFDEYSIA